MGTRASPFGLFSSFDLPKSGFFQQLSGVTERKRSYEKIPMEAELDEKEGRDENGKDKSISVSRRLAFFYTAPVTKFYCNMVSPLKNYVFRMMFFLMMP